MGALFSDNTIYWRISWWLLFGQFRGEKSPAELLCFVSKQHIYTISREFVCWICWEFIVVVQSNSLQQVEGGGTRSRSRGECSGTSSESEACNSNACVAAATAAPTSPPGSSTACGAWQPWSQCTASCGPATRMRSRGGECQPFLESEACSQAACVAPSPPQNPVASPSPTTMATTMATTVATTATTAVTGRPLTSNVVEVRMRIASDFSNAARDIDTFRESFRQGMADAAGISKDRIIVRKLSIWGGLVALGSHLRHEEVRIWW